MSTSADPRPRPGVPAVPGRPVVAHDGAARFAPAFEARLSAAGRLSWPLLVLVLVGLAAAFRWYLLIRFYATPDADQTVVALMARHILAGERPVFYWGQPYTGSLEAYLTAAIFRLFGQGDLALHVVPFCASVLFVLLVCLLARRLYGTGVAALSGLCLAVAPALLIDWSFWAGSGYLEAMALGTAALLLVLPRRDGESRASFPRVPLAFFLLGIGLWIQPVAAYYLLAVFATLAGRGVAGFRTPRRRLAGCLLIVACAVALAVGAAPLVLFNLQHDGATLTFLTARATHLDWTTVYSRALLWAGPVVLGFAPPTTDRAYFTGFLLAHYALYGVALWLELVLLFRGISRLRGVWRRLRTCLSARSSPDLGLLVLLGTLLLAFLTSSWGAEQWSASQPRYLLPIYTAVPLVIQAALPRCPRARQWAVAVLALAGVLAGNLYINTTAFGRPDTRPLARLLQEKGITAVYGDYWLVYPLIYQSDEHIAGAAVLDNLAPGRNRYSPYLRAAAASRHYAWIVQTGSARQRSVLACLAHLHSSYATYVWHDQTVYDQPTHGAYPWWNGGRCLLY